MPCLSTAYRRLPVARRSEGSLLEAGPPTAAGGHGDYGLKARDAGCRGGEYEFGGNAQLPAQDHPARGGQRAHRRTGALPLGRGQGPGGLDRSCSPGPLYPRPGAPGGLRTIGRRRSIWPPPFRRWVRRNRTPNET